MAFRRRRRSFGRRKGGRRRSYWAGAAVWIDNAALQNTSNGGGGFLAGEAFTWWVKWPAGQRSITDTISYPEEIEPIDETVVRTRSIFSCRASLNNLTEFQRHSYTIAFGIVAIDPGNAAEDLNGGAFAFNLDGSALPPFPLPMIDLGEDWIIRQIGTGVQNDVIYQPSAGDLDAYQSRAMRKLSPGVGLLAVLMASDPNEANSNDWTITAAFDTRCLFKSGVYTP